MLDQTGLTGKYTSNLWVSLGGYLRNADGATTPMADTGPSIFAALEQIGLQMEHQKLATRVMAIDHVDSP